jgi:hypothetical protein
MASKGGTIRNYFQRVPTEAAKNVADTGTAEPKKSEFKVGQVIRSSDDEEEDSDSSLEDLADMLKFRSSTQRSTVAVNSSFDASQKSKFVTRTNGVSLVSPSAAPKLRFDMKKLVDQAGKAEATEVVLQRVQALLEDDASITPDPAAHSLGHVHQEILGSVVAEQDGPSVEQVLRAVKRTEAVHAKCKWDFFQQDAVDVGARDFPYSDELHGWQEDLSIPELREQTILSGFARDVVTIGDLLPDEVFLWILDEICLHQRADLREGYAAILVASPEQISRLMQPDTIVNLFRKLGAKAESLDMGMSVKEYYGDHGASRERNWSDVEAVITLLGRVARCLDSEASITSICLLARLCIDALVLEHIGVLAAVQRTMEQLCGTIRRYDWQTTVRQTLAVLEIILLMCYKCSNICQELFNTVNEISLAYHMIRCLPASNPQANELRQRLALAFFFEDVRYTELSPQDAIDLTEIRTRLDAPHFRVTADTDYRQLAAYIALLDIGMGSGHSSSLPLVDAEAEQEFNRRVDVLVARVYIIWSHISDAGASFMSRMDAKEVLENFRHRLSYSVRTVQKRRKGAFDTNSDPVHEQEKQSAFMKKFFKKEE